jgi:hypothetical protein
MKANMHVAYIYRVKGRVKNKENKWEANRENGQINS